MISGNRKLVIHNSEYRELNVRTISDEELIALLHDELDPEHSKLIRHTLLTDRGLQIRYEVLASAPVGQFKQLLDQLIEYAPIRRMENKLDRYNANTPATRTAFWHKAHSLKIAAIASIAILLLAGYFLGKNLNATKVLDDWRESVAVYQALYTTETLNHIPTTSNTTPTATRLSKLSGMTITIPIMEDLNLQFKRGQLLEFNSTPLVQLAYLSAAGTPIAICFIQLDEANTALQSDKFYGLNTAFWTHNRVSVMIIGNLPQQSLITIANIIIAQQV